MTIHCDNNINSGNHNKQQALINWQNGRATAAKCRMQGFLMATVHSESGSNGVTLLGLWHCYGMGDDISQQ